MFPGAVYLLIRFRKVEILPFLRIEMLGYIFGDILDERLLIADITVDVLPALKIVPIFGLDIRKYLQYVLAVINALRYLTELLIYPVKVPGKFDEVKNGPVLLLLVIWVKATGSSCKGVKSCLRKFSGEDTSLPQSFTDL